MKIEFNSFRPQSSQPDQEAAPSPASQEEMPTVDSEPAAESTQIQPTSPEDLVQPPAAPRPKFGSFFGSVAGSVASLASTAAGKAQEAVSAGVDAAAPLASKVGESLQPVADAAKPLADSAAKAVQDGTQAVTATVGSAVSSALRQDVTLEGNLKDADGHYQMPDPIVNEREKLELASIEKAYQTLTAPGWAQEVGAKVKSFVPQQAKDLAKGIGASVEQAQIYAQAMELISSGFDAIEKQAARTALTPEYVVRLVNSSEQEENIASLDEICLLRSYDVSRIAGGERTQHLAMALTEGFATGVPGFAGLPANIVLSTFLFYRAVQSVALLYGYDVVNDASELMIADQVFTAGLDPKAGEKANGNANTVAKFMAFAEVSTVKQAVGKGWTAMAQQGGVSLLLVQMRALANKSARDALSKAGKGGLEKSVFKSVFQQMGRGLTQKAIARSVAGVGGVIGAAMDYGQMDTLLTYADLFYHKRFILEKEARARSLVEGVSYQEAVDEIVMEEDEQE